MGLPKLYALTQQMVRYAVIINFWHYFILFNCLNLCLLLNIVKVHTSEKSHGSFTY